MFCLLRDSVYYVITQYWNLVITLHLYHNCYSFHVLTFSKYSSGLKLMHLQVTCCCWCVCSDFSRFCFMLWSPQQEMCGEGAEYSLKHFMSPHLKFCANYDYFFVPFCTSVVSVLFCNVMQVMRLLCVVLQAQQSAGWVTVVVIAV
jgi:hypothetical protein